MMDQRSQFINPNSQQQFKSMFGQKHLTQIPKEVYPPMIAGKQYNDHEMQEFFRDSALSMINPVSENVQKQSMPY